MKYRKKPVVIEAVQLSYETQHELVNLINDDIGAKNHMAPRIHFYRIQDNPIKIIIMSAEGNMHAEHGDWIIKGIAGEFYPVKNEIFLQTYEEVE